MNLLPMKHLTSNTFFESVLALHLTLPKGVSSAMYFLTLSLKVLSAMYKRCYSNTFKKKALHLTLSEKVLEAMLATVTNLRFVLALCKMSSQRFI